MISTYGIISSDSEKCCAIWYRQCKQFNIKFLSHYFLAIVHASMPLFFGPILMFADI